MSSASGAGWGGFGEKVGRPGADGIEIPDRMTSPRSLPLGSVGLALTALCAALGLSATACSTPMMHYSHGDGAAQMEGQGTSMSGYLAPGEMRFKRSVCKDSDIHVDYRTLDENALADFLKTQGFETTAERARNDLVYIDIIKGEGITEKVRLRVAILKTPADAGRELHEAVLQHGEGSWGVHRANLAILAPIAATSDAVNFAVKTKLACWGVFVMAGRDDSFVVPGGYIEL